MARPEIPIDPHAGPEAAFAVELRQLRELADVTYRELAQRAHYSYGALCAAARGHRLPTWEVTAAFVKGCAGDQQQWRARWEAVAAEVGLGPATTPGNDGDEVATPSDSFDARAHLPGGDVPPLSSLTSPQDFHLALRALRTRVGNPSLRDLSVSARKHGDRVLPRSTLAGALARTDRLPSLEIVEAFLTACDVQVTEVDAVKSAWARVAYVLQRDSMPGSPRWQDSCPYLGLAAFTEDQAEVFHGREHMTTELLAKLTKRVHGCGGMLVVTGPSGAGKSSLLRAGLLPALAKGSLGPGSQDWPRLVITPGSAPLDELAVHLAQLAGVNSAEVRESLAEHPDTAHLNVRQALLACAAEQAGAEPRVAPSRLVLIVDRFEELFTVVSDKTERTAFITSLCAMAGVGRRATELPPAIVVLGLRADFFSNCTAYAPLAEVMQSRMFVVGPMTEVELRSAITGPAAAAGLSIEAGLVDNILAELRSTDTADGFDPGALPLLSQAMFLAWKHREGTTLTRHAYATGGGIHNGIQKSADEVYDNLTPEQQEAARMLFRRMVTFTSQGQPTRCSLQLNDLSADDDVRAALEEFTNKRLITLRRDAAEIVHEVLVHTWDRLKKWIDQDRDRLCLHRELESAASVWEENERDPAFLYRGSRLAAVQEIPNGANSAASPSVQSFLDSSRNYERRSKRKQRGLRISVGLLAVVVVFLAGGGLVQWKKNATAQINLANKNIELTTADAEATSSKLLTADHPDGSMLLAVAASRLATTPVTRDALFNAQSQYFAGQLLGHEGTINKVVFSLDGNTLATASTDGTARLWDVASRREVARLLGLGRVNDVEFSRDGSLLAAAGTNGTTQLWNVARRKLIGQFIDDTYHALSGSSGIDISAATFSPDGNFLATASKGGIARLWDVSTQRLIVKIPSPGLITKVAFSPNGRVLATTGANSIVQLWNVTDPPHPTQLGQPLSLADRGEFVNAVAFSPEGEFLAAAATDGAVRLWNVVNLPDSRIITTLPDQSYITNAVVFSPDGKTLATAGENGIVRLWDVFANRLVATLKGHNGAVTSVAFHPDGHAVATAGSDSIVRLWDIGGPILSSPTISADVDNMEFSPDGRILATVGGDGTSRLWDFVSRSAIPMLTGYVGKAVAFDGDGRLLATADINGNAQLWDMASRRPIPSLFPGRINKVVFSPKGHILATTDADQQMRLWNVTDPYRPVSLSRFPIGRISDAVAFSGNGRLLATVGTDGAVKIWDLANQHPITSLTGGFEFVNKVVFSPDDGSLITASGDGTVRRWQVATGRLTACTPIIAQPLARNLRLLALSPDGRFLATTDSVYTETKVWDMDQDGKLVATLAGHSGSLNTAVFSPDGRVLATASGDGTVRRWDLDADVITTHLCGIIGTIDKVQWEKFMPKSGYQPVCR